VRELQLRKAWYPMDVMVWDWEKWWRAVRLEHPRNASCPMVVNDGDEGRWTVVRLQQSKNVLWEIWARDGGRRTDSRLLLANAWWSISKMESGSVTEVR